MSQRRYYVLSTQGQIGPHNRLEIRDLLRAGDIAEHDQLRTAAGTNTGTVNDLLNKPEESSSYRLTAADVVEPGRPTAPTPRRSTHGRRHSESDALVTVAASDDPRRLPIVTIALSVTLAVLLIGWWWLSSGERHREAEQIFAVAALPVVTVTGEDGSWVLGRDASFTIRTARTVESSLTVQLSVTGSAIPGVDFSPFPTQVVIPAGAELAHVTCTPSPVTNSRQPAVAIVVAIAPHPGYQVGKAPPTTVVLRPEESDKPHAEDALVTWVGDLPFVSEWSCDHPPGRNQSYGGHQLIIDHISYPKGLSVHPGAHDKEPEAHATFALDGRFREFLATVGIDEEVRDKAEPSAIFQVWVDDQPQFDSGVMRASTPARNIRINVTGAKILRLVVTDAGDSNFHDHADWGGARLLRSSSE